MGVDGKPVRGTGECGCCDRGEGGKNVIAEQAETKIYRFQDFPGETQEEKDEAMNKRVAAASGDLFCAQCDAEAATCSSCSEGSRLTERGECVRCREAMSHCQTCATGADNQCEKCYKNVAELDDKGHCTNCVAPWVPETVDGATKCQCPHHINVKGGMKCQKCGDLIPGCRVCEQTDDPARG